MHKTVYQTTIPDMGMLAKINEYSNPDDEPNEFELVICSIYSGKELYHECGFAHLENAKVVVNYYVQQCVQEQIERIGNSFVNTSFY